MSQINEFLNRAAVKTGFKREYYMEKNVTTSLSNIMLVPFYGDIRSTFNLSSLLLKQYKEKNRDLYVILCSWPGYREFFPYVDEYWTLSDESTAKTLATDANNFYNQTNLASEINRNLLEIANTLNTKDLKVWHDNGFTKKYWEDFGVSVGSDSHKHLKRFLPDVPSSSKLSASFINELDRKVGKKVVVFPVTKMKTWHQGHEVYMPVQKGFWDALLEMLLKEGFVPVVYQNWYTYDMSRDFTDRCVYLVPRSISDVLAAMRHIGLVLDIHSGVSRLAIAARTPFICVDERLRFIETSDYVVDDLCCETPRQYIFSFSTLLMTGGPDEWKDSLLDNILVTLKSFNPTESGHWGATTESYQTISYERVRQRNAKRHGVAFMSSSKLKEKLNGQCHPSKSRNEEEVRRPAKKL